MSRGQVGYIALFMIAVFLIVVGVQGDLGLVVGIVFCPNEIVIGDAADSTTTATFS